jgi:hypothetical protein
MIASDAVVSLRPRPFALGPPGRPFGDGLHKATASETGGLFDRLNTKKGTAGSTLKSSISGRRMGGAQLGRVFDVI